MIRIKIDISEVAAKLGQVREVIENRVVNAVETLSVQTHAFIINTVNAKLAGDDFKRKFYLGLGEYGKKSQGQGTQDERIDATAKNVRWVKISDGIWMVELDESAEWIENGRDSVFMEWLLQGKSAKTAKDGSRYAVIPFKQTKGNKEAPNAKPAYAQLIKNQAKRQGISLTKIENNPDGSPKTGVLHKLRMTPSGTPQNDPSSFSAPRSPETALLVGLKPHDGIYKLQGAVVTQRKNKKGKVEKETVVFRVISSKHKAEGNRWMYPAVKALNIFPEAEKWALETWDRMVKDIEQQINQG